MFDIEIFGAKSNQRVVLQKPLQRFRRFHGFRTCGNDKTAKATICEPHLRTLNRKAACGSAEDRYYYSPWRAPGSAPVFDSCGMAGGSLWSQGPGGWAPGGNASAGVRYHNIANRYEGSLFFQKKNFALYYSVKKFGDDGAFRRACYARVNFVRPKGLVMCKLFGSSNESTPLPEPFDEAM